MPIKVTLVSPRSKLSLKTKSTVSVTSEFEYLNLPSVKRKTSKDTERCSPPRNASSNGVSGQMSRVKSVINNLKELSSKNTIEPPPPSIQPPARGKEMSAPARPPKTSSYKDLISEPVSQVTNGRPGLGHVTCPQPMRTSTPAPGSEALEADFLQTLTSEARLRTTGGHVRDIQAMDNFEYFASGLQRPPVKEEEQSRLRQAKEAKLSDPGKPPVASSNNKPLGHFISLRSLPGPGLQLVLDQSQTGIESRDPASRRVLRSRSPSPPPPPSSGPSSLRLEEDSLPPPPSCSTLKRLSTYRRSDRESKREMVEREQRPGPVVSRETSGDIGDMVTRERLNMTVTGAEPSSPCRVAAAGAAGWQKFLGRSGGRSVSVHLSQEEANAVRERRQKASVPCQESVKELTSTTPGLLEDKENSPLDSPAPPLPPKPKQKISMIGLPNAEHFIVMDNSAMFSKTVSSSKLETSTTSSSVSSSSVSMVTTQVMSQEQCHSRSDSGLSSLSSWTNVTGTKSGSSSVRSSSIVSDCSSKIEELLDDQTNKNTTFLSQCSLKLENLAEEEQDTELCEKEEMTGENQTDHKDELQGIVSPNHATDEPQKSSDNYDYDDACQSSTVQRQLETIKQQKEILIKDIVHNEELGMSLTRKLEEVMSPKEREKYNTFLEELEKVVLLVLSIKVRLQKAEEELSCGNLTDWDKESRRYKRDKLVKQFTEAGDLKSMSDRRMKNVESIIEKHLTSEDLETFRTYIDRKEELLTAQRACEDSEKNILL